MNLPLRFRTSLLTIAFVITTVVTVSIVSVSTSLAATPTPDVAATQTAIVEGFIATMTAQAPTETPTLGPPTATPTKTPTATPTSIPPAAATETAVVESFIATMTAQAPTATPTPTDTLTPTPDVAATQTAVVESFIATMTAEAASLTPPPLPTETPTGIATPEVEGLLFEDDFNDPQRAVWDTYSGEDYEVGYEAGQYSVLVKKENWVAWSGAEQYFTDFALEVEASQVAGPNNNNYGVLVRYQDADNFYDFRISGDGYYAVKKLENDEWSTLADWTQSPHINQGQSTNHLLVICQGSQMSFYVNDQHLVDVSDDTFSAGDIALAAGTYDEPGVHIRFDNLKVWTPEGFAARKPPIATPEVEEGLLFEDDFSDPQHAEWDIYSDKDSKGDYEADQYSILVKKENWIAWGRPRQRFTDFALEVDTTQVAGPDNNGYGVLCRYQDVDNFYYFRITGDGYYSVMKLENGEWIKLEDWVSSPHINQGQSTNHLAVICQGPQMSFYVNDQHLVDVSDDTFSAGDIALAAEAFDQTGVHIRFDNLKVWTPAGFAAKRPPIATPTLISVIPELDDVALTLNDLPSGFEERDPAELDIEFEDLTAEGITLENFFAYVEEEREQLVMGFIVSYKDERGQAVFDTLFDQPEETLDFLGLTDEGEIWDVEELADLDDIGHKSAGFTMPFFTEDATLVNFDMVVFRREMVGATVFVVYEYWEGESPVWVGDMARELDDRIAEALSP